MSKHGKERPRFKLLLISFTVTIALISLIVAISYKKNPQLPAEFFHSEAVENARAQSTAETETEPEVESKNDDWHLILVNSENPLDESYEFEQMELKGGDIIDVRIYADLQEMFNDARAQGIFPKINSAYRTREEQQNVLDRKVAAYIEEGRSIDESVSLANDYVMKPGTSEHETGLAIDLTAEDNKCTLEALQGWFKQNSWQYGFIMRYPPDKTEITDVAYEPWHYRYVGKEAAKIIYNNNICLEEYLSGNYN